MPPLLISFCIGQPLYRKEKRPFPNVSASCYSESEVLLCFEMMFSGVHEAIIKLIYTSSCARSARFATFVRSSL